tara:strand:- start:315771 stop:316133 length:363 start_codon:yes stop_codon:yes gene_type:complete
MSTKDDNYYVYLARRTEVADYVKLQEGLTRVIEPKTDKVFWLTPKQELWCRKLAELKIKNHGRGIYRAAALAAGYGDNCKTEKRKLYAADRASGRNRENRGCYLRLIEIINEIHQGSMHG